MCGTALVRIFLKWALYSYTLLERGKKEKREEREREREMEAAMWTLSFVFHL
jgi:hypothetical protein